MNKKMILFPLCAALLLSGCSSLSKNGEEKKNWPEGTVQIGSTAGITAPERFTLLDNKETLAADGLYYASWGTGSCVPYENDEGDTVDLYDAQLYFLTSESMSEEKTEGDRDKWLAVAKENYEVHTENSVTLNGQTYTVLTYDCISEDSPYDRGVSAFGVCGTTAVCAELTCLEDYTEDLETILTEFLNGCYFTID